MGETYETQSRYDGYTWRPSAASANLVWEANRILGSYTTRMTVRQLYYRLVAELIIPNNVASYHNLVNVLTKARKVDLIAADRFVDRGRATTGPSGYDSLRQYINIIRNAYTRKPNDGQPHYVEVWTEKDALSVVIGDAADEYGVTLVVSKGYSSYTILTEAAKRLSREIERRGSEGVHLLYFGDFDPSGEDIFRVICDETVALTGYSPHIEKIALTRALIDQYNLPPIPTKSTDTRTLGFVAAHGDEAVELDALPPDELEVVVRSAVERYWDPEIREGIIHKEEPERAALHEALKPLDDLKVE